MNNVKKPLEWGDLNPGDWVWVKPPFSRLDFNEGKQYKAKITSVNEGLSRAFFEVEDDAGFLCYCISHNCSFFPKKKEASDWILVGRV